MEHLGAGEVAASPAAIGPFGDTSGKTPNARYGMKFEVSRGKGESNVILAVLEADSRNLNLRTESMQ
jgi:hypothetical protein